MKNWWRYGWMKFVTVAWTLSGLRVSFLSSLNIWWYTKWSYKQMRKAISYRYFKAGPWQSYAWLTRACWKVFKAIIWQALLYTEYGVWLRSGHYWIRPNLEMETWTNLRMNSLTALTSDVIFFDVAIEIFVPILIRSGWISEYLSAIWCKSFSVVLSEKWASNWERRIVSGIGGTALILIIPHKMRMCSSRAFYMI